MGESEKVFDGSQSSQTYEIQVRAILDLIMAEWLGDLSVRRSGDEETVLTGSLPDQAALYGILLRLHYLGIPLVSVNPLSRDPYHCAPTQ